MVDAENKPVDRYVTHTSRYTGTVFVRDTVTHVLHPCSWEKDACGSYLSVDSLDYPRALAYPVDHYEMPSTVVDRICKWLNDNEGDKSASTT